MYVQVIVKVAMFTMVANEKCKSCFIMVKNGMKGTGGRGKYCCESQWISAQRSNYFQSYVKIQLL